MGNYAIHIEGVGCHHNGDAEYDADRIARDAVKKLREHGHQIDVATITHGGAENLEEEVEACPGCGREQYDRSCYDGTCGPASQEPAG